MDYHLTPYSAVHLFTVIMALIVIPPIWRRRITPGATWLVLMELSAAVWAFSSTFEMAATTVPLKILWSQISYLGVATAPVLFFIFAVRYTQQYSKHLTRRAIPLLFVVPVLTFIVILSDRFRPWHWSSLTIDPATNIGLYGHGPWFWLFVVYNYVLVLMGIFALFRAMIRFPAYYRSQMALLVIGAVLPLAANAVYVSGLNPVRGMEWTPTSFALMGIFLAWGIFRQKMFTLVPVARERLIEGMMDGVVVVDAGRHIVDMNPSAQAMIGRLARDAVGQPASHALAHFGDLAELLRTDEQTAAREICLGEGEAQRFYDLRVSPLRDRRGRTSGHLIVMREITRRRKAEQERERLITELQEALAQVQTLKGLLPICAHCKKIRDDRGYWHSVEAYFKDHSDTDFTHSICPDCMKEHYSELFEGEGDDTPAES